MVYLTGDVHGFHNLKQRLSQFSLERENKEHEILIVLGDFGLLWDKHEYGRQVKEIKVFIEKFLPNFTLAFLDGNHENFELLGKYPSVHRWNSIVGQISDNIFRLYTGYIYEIEGEKYAVYGGATSIDKDHRIEGVSWWKEEIPSISIFNMMGDNLSRNDFKVDYLLTHTCAKTDMWLIDKYPFTGKLEDPVANDIKVIKDTTEIKKLHAFGHMHIDKNLIEDYKMLAMFETIYKIPKGQE